MLLSVGFQRGGVFGGMSPLFKASCHEMFFSFKWFKKSLFRFSEEAVHFSLKWLHVDAVVISYFNSVKSLQNVNNKIINTGLFH